MMQTGWTTVKIETNGRLLFRVLMNLWVPKRTRMCNSSNIKQTKQKDICTKAVQVYLVFKQRSISSTIVPI